MGFSGGAALPLQRIIYGPSIETAQRVDQTPPGNPFVDPGNAGPILLASQAASRCRDRTPAAHRTRGETTLRGGVASAEGTPTETRIDGLFAPQAEREPDSALLELAGRGRRHASAPRNFRLLEGQKACKLHTLTIYIEDRVTLSTCLRSGCGAK